MGVLVLSFPFSLNLSLSQMFLLANVIGLLYKKKNYPNYYVLQSTVGTLHKLKYYLAVNLVDREIETFLLNLRYKIGNLSFGDVQYCCVEKLFPNMLP